jgi:hypothetical protein
MDPWAWILAYVVGFALLQLLLYRYLGRDARGTDAATPTAREGSAGLTGGAHAPTGDAVTCRHCGAENDREASYRFCRECTSPLA